MMACVANGKCAQVCSLLNSIEQKIVQLSFLFSSQISNFFLCHPTRAVLRCHSNDHKMNCRSFYPRKKSEGKIGKNINFKRKVSL